MVKYFSIKEDARGFNAYEAKKVMRDRNYFGCMMVECGDADAMISGLTKIILIPFGLHCILSAQKKV